jgi:hypothetical protein
VSDRPQKREPDKYNPLHVPFKDHAYWAEYRSRERKRSNEAYKALRACMTRSERIKSNLKGIGLLLIPVAAFIVLAILANL